MNNGQTGLSALQNRVDCGATGAERNLERLLAIRCLSAKKIPTEISIHFPRNMNKGCLYVLVVLCALSLAEAARKKAFYFNLYNELQGSWILMQSKVSITSGNLIGLSEQRMFNVTKSDIPNELVLAEIDLNTREEKRKPFQLLVSASDNFTAEVNVFEPGADEEVRKQLAIKFDQFIKDEFYVSPAFLA